MAEEYDVLYDPSNDFYRLLDISSSATIDEIRQVYRQRAKEVHPDRNPQRKAWASQQFKRINEAYNVLTDDDLRAEYDRQRYFYLFDAFSTAPEPAKPKAQPKQTQYPGTYDQPKKQVNWLRIVLGL